MSVLDPLHGQSVLKVEGLSVQATGFKAGVDKLFKDKLCLTSSGDRVYKGGCGAPCKAEGDQTCEGQLPDVGRHRGPERD